MKFLSIQQNHLRYPLINLEQKGHLVKLVNYQIYQDIYKLHEGILVLSLTSHLQFCVVGVSKAASHGQFDQSIAQFHQKGHSNNPENSKLIHAKKAIGFHTIIGV